MSVRNRSTRTVSSTRPVTRNPRDTQEVILRGIVRVLGRRQTWNGSMTELGYALATAVRAVPVDFPENPRGLRARVDGLVKQLRRAGIKTRFGRTNDHARKRFVEFTRSV